MQSHVSFFLVKELEQHEIPFFAACVLTCHSRKIIGVTNKGLVLRVSVSYIPVRQHRRNAAMLLVKNVLHEG